MLRKIAQHWLKSGPADCLCFSSPCIRCQQLQKIIETIWQQWLGMSDLDCSLRRLLHMRLLHPPRLSSKWVTTVSNKVPNQDYEVSSSVNIRAFQILNFTTSQVALNFNAESSYFETHFQTMKKKKNTCCKLIVNIHTCSCPWCRAETDMETVELHGQFQALSLGCESIVVKTVQGVGWAGSENNIHPHTNCNPHTV